VAIVPVATTEEEKPPGDRPPGYGAPPDSADEITTGRTDSDEPDVDPSTATPKA
jgi:hypothetical protein